MIVNPPDTELLNPDGVELSKFTTTPPADVRVVPLPKVRVKTAPAPVSGRVFVLQVAVPLNERVWEPAQVAAFAPNEQLA